MPPLSFVIVIIVLLLVMYFFYTFFRTVFKVLIAINVIMFLFMGIIFSLIIADVNKMKSNIDANRLYVFAQDDKALSAFIVNGSEKPVILEEEQLQAISSQLSLNDLAKILANNNLLYVYRSNLIDNTNFKLEFSGKSLNPQDILEILNSSADKNLKAFIFANIVNTFTQKGTDIIKGLKAGSIIIYPETLTFRILRYIPDSIIDYTKQFTGKEVNNGILEQA